MPTRASRTPKAKAVSIPLAQGASSVPNRATFDKLAARDDLPGVASAPTMKFLLMGIDGASPATWLINSRNIKYHYLFAQKALGSKQELAAFNHDTYVMADGVKDARHNLAGTIVAHDSWRDARGATGKYVIEFWPTDRVRAPNVAIAFRLLSAAMPLAAGKLAYHPAGDTQEALARTDAAALKRLGVPVISTDELFRGVTFQPLNLGDGYGYLRILAGTPGDVTPTARDVVVYRQYPNDLSHVAGIITDEPQTPLSHINLKAQQNHTPNAYVRGASSNPRITALAGKLVHYQVTAEAYTIEPADAAAARKAMDKLRPRPNPRSPGGQYPMTRDLSVKEIRPLSSLSHGDAPAFGGKAANLGELLKLLPKGMSPSGFAVPEWFYDRFMEESGLYRQAERMMADARFREGSDPEYRARKLKDLQKAIKDAPMPAALEKQIVATQKKFPAAQPIRARSSSNVEDGAGFNGAGLHDSYTQRPGEGSLSKSVKQVWASLWNYRAFEEREWFRLEHRTAAMAVALHPNTDDERANGVAITKNIYDPAWPGFYINSQLGENLVTNPQQGAVPDEMLVSAIGERGEYETQFIRHSNLVAAGQRVLDASQVSALVTQLELIQGHFRVVYKRQKDPSFAMDVEFKITREGRLWIKQARPTVS